MFKNLNTGAIGIRNKSLAETIVLAKESGYKGIDFDIKDAAQLAAAHGTAYVRDLFAANGIVPGLWGLPVAWNQDHWRDDLAQLPSLAALGAELGCTRTATWCPSWSDSRPYEENWAWHIERYRAIAQVLAEHGCRLGIEFLGPKTLRTGHPYEFISTMDEMLRLAAEVGTGNVGLLLDAYHQYTGGGTPADLDRITAADVITVHVNDALAGVPVDELPDLDRRLPLETGVIDLAAFMRKLDAMGYDGPVTTEPFSARINAIAAENPLAAAREVSAAMDKLWQAGGIGA